MVKIAEELGAAYVSILPSLKGFSVKLKAELKREIGKGISIGINPDGTGLAEKVKAITDRAKAEIRLPVKVDEARAALAGREASDAANKAAGPIKLRLDVPNAALKALSSRVRSSLAAGLSGLTSLSGKGLLLGTGVTALAGLGAAAAKALPQIGALVSSLVTASGALIAIPGIAAVAGAGLATIAVGLHGVSDALGAAASGDVAKLDTALQGLAPNAKAFVKQVAALRPAFQKLQLSVQSALFANTAKVLKDLAGSTLPVLTAGMTGLASIINGAVVSALTRLNTTATRSLLARVFADASSAARTFGTALAPIGQALLAIVAVGAQVTTQVAGPLTGLITQFADKVTALGANGGLAKIFNDGLSALGQFVALGRNVLGIVTGIFSAAGSAGQSGIFSLFQRLNDLINSIAGQTALRSIFTQLAQIGADLAPVFSALLTAVVPVADAIARIAAAFSPGLAAVAGALGMALAALAPAIVSLSPALSKVALYLVPVGQGLAQLVAAFAPGFVDLVSGLGMALTRIGDDAAPLGAIFSQLASIVAGALPTIGSIISGLLTAAGPGLLTFIDALGQALDQLAPLAPVIGAAIGQLAVSLVPLLPSLVQLAQTLIVGVLPALLPLVPPLVNIAQILASALVPVLQVIVPLLNLLAPVFGPLVSEILAVTAAVKLWAIAQGILDIALDANPIGLIALAIVALVGAVIYIATKTDWFQKLWAAAWAGIKLTFASVAFAVTTTLHSLAGLFDLVVGKVTGLKSSVQNALSDAKNWLINAGKNIIQGLINGLENAVPGLRGALGAITKLIPSWKGPMSVDKRLLFDNGVAIMGSLESGLLSKKADVRDTLGGITRALPEFIPMPSTAALTPAATSGRLTAEWVGGAAADPIVTALRQHIRISFGGDAQAAFGTAR